jgi:ABC-2 type transport system permease protein
MAFLLPPAIFIVFAAIFQGTSGERMELSISLGMREATETNRRLEAALRAAPSLRIHPDTLLNEAAVAAQVQHGTADAGLFIRGDISVDADGPIVVLVDRGKVAAGAILSARVQEAVAAALPDVSVARTAPGIERIVGGFSPDQTARLGASIETLAQAAPDKRVGSALITTGTVGPVSGPGGIITYYVGAVAILFLLFSAMQSSATLIEERDTGIMDRLAVAPGATDAIVVGRFVFLVIQGVAQTTLIFAVAAALYGVDILGNFGMWALATLSASGAAAGLGLAVAAAASTRQQAQTITTFVVLLCSAVGGSMVPRFMMPAWLQEIGWYTPNAWAIEAYNGVLWRGETFSQIVPSLALLALMAVIGLAVAMTASRMRLRR